MSTATVATSLRLCAGSVDNNGCRYRRSIYHNLKHSRRIQIVQQADIRLPLAETFFIDANVFHFINRASVHPPFHRSGLNMMHLIPRQAK